MLTKRLLQLALVVGTISTAGIAAILLSPKVVVAFGGAGLVSARYVDTEFLASGDLSLSHIRFLMPDGTAAPTESAGVLTVESSTGRLIRTFAWGDIAATYQPRGSRLDIEVVVTNRTTATIESISVQPLALRLPAPPVEFDGSSPMMAQSPGTPAVVALHFDSGTIVAAANDGARPLLVGFPWPSDRPSSTVYPLLFTTGRHPAYPSSYPTVERNIGPGQSETFHVSLRFGAAHSPPEQLASDIYRAFASLFPPTLDWTDRRVIGQLVLATTQAGWPSNPRGWLLDASLDTGTAAGRSAFETAVLAWADGSVKTLKALNAQGMVLWDVEGQEFEQPTTYLCDPRVLGRAAPEMDAVADRFFMKFRAAGLRVGVCVRPQELEWPEGGRPTQRVSSNPARVLIDKITYAKARWGATMFYVDSNGDPNFPLDAGIFARVLEAHPDVLLIPEHENSRYYAYTAPYREMRQDHVATPTMARVLYPRAFGVTYVADGNFDRHRTSLTDAVKRGDALMVRGWFADPASGEAQKTYQAAGKE